METLLAIIIVVFGLLQIILFFKIWGMTNDVNDIKNILDSALASGNNNNTQKSMNKFSEGDTVINIKTEKIMVVKDFDWKIKKYHCYSESGIYEGSFKEVELDIYDI